MAHGGHAISSKNPYHQSFNICTRGKQNGNLQNYNVSQNQRKYNQSFYSNYFHDTTQPEFHCDMCDRTFRSNDLYKKHVSEHVTCGRSGCKFTAHPKIVENHVRMQHNTGIFNSIKKLNNPDEIQKWIAERKRRYPTQKNIENTIQIEKAKIARGEMIKQKNSRFNDNLRNNHNKRERNDRRLAKGKRQRRRAQKRCEKRVNNVSDSSASDFQDSNVHSQIPIFRGIGSLETNSEEAESNDFVDKVYMSDEDLAVEAPPPALNKSLALLMASYDSGNESEIDKRSAPHESDGEPPEEIKTTVDRVPIQPDAHSEQNIKKQKILNVKERNTSKVRGGISRRQCREPKPKKLTLLQKLLSSQVDRERRVIMACVRYIVHSLESEEKGRNKKLIKPSAMKIGQTLLQGLLKNEIVHERNVILQCVRHVVHSHLLFGYKRDDTNTTNTN